MMSTKEVGITTLDNPYNPFKEFNAWFMFDIQKGYNTCAYLDRVANLTPDMSDEQANLEVERAVDEIIRNDFLNIYKKVTRND